MQTMDQDTKNKIRELEHRKIDLNEQLSMTNSTVRFKRSKKNCTRSMTPLRN